MVLLVLLLGNNFGRHQRSDGVRWVHYELVLCGRMKMMVMMVMRHMEWRSISGRRRQWHIDHGRLVVVVVVETSGRGHHWLHQVVLMVHVAQFWIADWLWWWLRVCTLAHEGTC